MNLFLTWLAFFATQLAATISPGPAFVITVKNTISRGRKSGIYTAIGLGLGVATHVGLVLAGLATLIANSVFFYNLVKYAGATYLVYIGIKGLSAKRRDHAEESSESKATLPEMTPHEAVKTGFLTNMLNPKPLVFFTAVFTQFIHPDTPQFMLAVFWSTATLIEALWFILVSILLSQNSIKIRFLNSAHLIDRICGALMIALGIKLAL